MHLAHVHEKLNTYLRAELGSSLVLPDAKELERQQENFLMKFGPEQLEDMNDQELLREIPHNASNRQSMDYWLEFKNDDEFDQSLFGSIAGGSAAKFLTWQQKDTEEWLVLTPHRHAISEDEALGIVKRRRTEILDSARALKRFKDMPVEDIDPAKFQAAIKKAAPTTYNYGWMHKYLHIAFPGLVTWNTTRRWLEAQLYSVGLVPPNTGTYSCGIEIIRFWNSLPALSHLPTQVRYRAGKNLHPRDHWCLNRTHDYTFENLVEGHLSFGPQSLGDLTSATALKRRDDIAHVVEMKFEHAELGPESSDMETFIDLIYRLREGSIIALMSAPSSVTGLFEVIGGYHYELYSEQPHQVPVEGFDIGPFDMGRPTELRAELQLLKPTDYAVAAMESLLLLERIGGKRKVDNLATAIPMDFGQDDSSEPASGPMVPQFPTEETERRVAEMLERKKQVILYGPPGTGKTYYAERTALELVARRNFNCLPIQLNDAQRRDIRGEGGSTPYITTCTFHPMYSYEDFIEGYRPDEDGFKPETGIFKRMAEAAAKQPKKCFVLIIDEINRGNIPKIFGELIMLIEKSKRSTTSSLLPLSKEPFTVPSNLLIIGTMNTADRSILLIDTALRRRFAFVELLPEPKLLQSESINGVPLGTWLHALNRRVVENLGRDGRNLQIGHAYLMMSDGKPAATLRRIGEIFRDDIWPLLQEYCYEDPKKLASILGSRLYNEGDADLRHDLFKPGREDDLARALNSIVDDLGDAMLETEEEEEPPPADDDDEAETDSTDTET